MSKFYLLILVLIIFNSSCYKNRNQNDETNDYYESYRYELWKNLVENNYNFDFIGTQVDNGSYEDYDGQNFDVDHEGPTINSNFPLSTQ